MPEHTQTEPDESRPRTSSRTARQSREASPASGNADASATPAPAPLRSNEFIEDALRRWGDTVLRLAVGQLRNTADAEDVLQDVFVRLLKDSTSFNDDEHLKAWLLRVTINRCFDVRKAGKRRQTEPLEDRFAAPKAPDLLESDVWEAMGTLPEDLRVVVHLFYVDGYSTDEVAGIVDCRPATVRTRLHRARKRMKAALETMHLAGRTSNGVPALADRAPDDVPVPAPSLVPMSSSADSAPRAVAFRKGGRS